MELKGTIQSVKSMEKVLTTSFPCKLLHDGGQQFGQGEKSKNYSKLYHLFPKGMKQLWEERVNVRFHFDERFGLGTMKISAQGIEMMPQEIQHLILAKIAIADGVYYIPKKNLSLEQARELGALNLDS